MDREYRRWLDERKHREQMARTVQTPKPERRDGTLETAVIVPAAQALAIGVGLALLAGGLAALFGVGLALAAKLAAAGGIVGTGGGIVLFVVQERGIRLSPVRLAWERLALAEPQPPPELDDAEPWRVIRPYTAKAAPMIVASATAMEHAAEPVEPSARPETRELHDFICANWGRNGTGNLSRDACRKRGFTRAAWEKFIGGKRGKAGNESARGILDRAGVVEKTSTGWQWKDGATLADVFNVQAELAAYADARAKMGIKRQDRTARTGQDGTGGTSEPSRTRKG